MSEWIRWFGHGIPPVMDGWEVEVELRSGEKMGPYQRGGFAWNNTGSGWDIIAYRVVERRSGSTPDVVRGDAPGVWLATTRRRKEDWAHLTTPVAGTPFLSTLTVTPPPGNGEGNTDADGEGKQTNPKDLVGSKKVPLSTLPFRVLWRIGLAMLEGMSKYGRHNYRHAGVRASVYFDGAMRHLGAWWEGEDIDPDSGFNHIDKLLADLMVMRDSMLEGNFVDDRPPRGKDDFVFLNAEAKRIVEIHAGKKPRHFTIADSK